MRPFRFGIQVYTAISAGEWAAKACRAEGLGYETLSMPDHVGPYFAPAPALMAAAAATTRLRVGSFVFDNDFRHPVLLANEAATLDLLTEGRFFLGLGAGWRQAEYEALGIPFDPPAVRLRRLEEAVQVIKQFFGGESFSFAGEHYRVTEIAGFPRPCQRPHPPLLIGGGGRRVLTLAARAADIVGFNPRLVAGGTMDPASMTASALTEKVGWVRAAAGARLADLEFNLQLHHVVVTGDRQAGAAGIAAETGQSVARVLDTPHVAIGTAGEIAAQLDRLRAEHGISYINVRERFLETFAPVVERLAGR